MEERRNQKTMVLLSPTERRALQAMSDRDGMSMSDTLRRLIRAEAYQRDLIPPTATKSGGNRQPVTLRT